MERYWEIDSYLGDLDDHVVQRRLEASSSGLGHRVANVGQSFAWMDG
jgi:hypothetical protein